MGVHKVGFDCIYLHVYNISQVKWIGTLMTIILLCIEGKTIHVDRVVTAFTDTAINKNLKNLHAQYMLIQWIKRDGRIIGNQEIPTS